MSRVLPLSPTGQPDDPPSPASPAAVLSGSVAVFDPALCCPTGLCGPGVDPALLAISRDLRWLEKQGATVTRAGLSTTPDAFVGNTRVQGLLEAFGDGALPATLVNGQVLTHGRYPTRDELIAALSGTGAANRLARTLSTLPVANDDGHCAPGSGCC